MIIDRTIVGSTLATTPGVDTDDAARVIAIVCWTVVILRGTRARHVDVLWWACVFTALTVTLSVPSNARWLADASGVDAVATVLANVSAVVAGALLIRWQALASTRADQPPLPLPLLVGGAGVVAVVLVATWFATPTSGSATGTHPAIALHWCALHVALLAAAVIVGSAALQAVGSLPFGGVRSATGVIVAAAACLGLASVAGVGAQVAVFAGRPAGDLLPPLIGTAHALFVVLFSVAVAVPLLRPMTRRSLETEVRAVGARLGCGDPLVEPDPMSPLFPLVVDIRDRVWQLQHHVDRAQLAAAIAYARALRLSGVRARSFTLAVCLEMGLRAEAADPDGRVLEPADLSRLGGGRTPSEEARWLVRLARIRRVGDVPLAARRILARVPAITQPADGVGS